MERAVIAICIAAVLIAVVSCEVVRSHGRALVEAACIENGRYLNWRGTCVRYD
jgi:hypothetical protein